MGRHCYRAPASGRPQGPADTFVYKGNEGYIYTHQPLRKTSRECEQCVTITKEVWIKHRLIYAVKHVKGHGFSRDSGSEAVLKSTLDWLDESVADL